MEAGSAVQEPAGERAHELLTGICCDEVCAFVKLVLRCKGENTLQSHM